MSAVLPIVSKLSPRVIRVLGCNPGKMTLQGTNTYILGTGKRRILFDTGEPNNQEYLDQLKSVLKEGSLTIDKIIISHWHDDHIGGLKGVSNILDNDHSAWKHPRTDEKEETSGIHFLKDGEQILTEGASLRVHHTPGHTTDHIVLYLEEENAVFSGDCILGEGTTVFEDLYHYMKSLDLILGLNPEIVYPGHGPVVEEAVEKIKFYIKHRNDREEEIKNILLSSENRGHSIMDLVKIIYKDYPENLHLPAAHSVNLHLLKLEKEGIVQRENQDGDDMWRMNK